MKPVRGPDTVFLDSGSFHPVYVLIINSPNSLQWAVYVTLARTIKCEGATMFDSSKIQPHIAFTDLRELMSEAEKLGELRTVLGASWQEDIGLASDVVVPRD